MSESGMSWRARGIKRRDERHTKIEVRPPSVGSAKKDTRRWCRGRVGREHTPVCVDYNQHKRAQLAVGWKILVCSTCNKELEHWWPSPYWVSRKPLPPPAWVKFND